ncbi:MAG: 3-hydroxyisobutyrate dehydrogenase [Psychrobacter glaciei]|jgi:3-hydroxyisobutyrate dehydrogenase
MIEQKTTIGFIGVGLMGLPMCRQLLSASANLYVYNRNSAKCEPLISEGAKQASTLQDIAKYSDVIMLCVSNTQSVEAVMEVLLPNLRSGQLIIDFSSISPEATLMLAKQVQAVGASWIDCPVSGGVAGAETGSLVMMAGGTAEDLERAMPLLKPLSQRVTHMGPSGAGQTTKVCNQMIVSCNVLVMAEALALAKKAGVDTSKIPPALQGGFADSLPLQLTGSRMAIQDFDDIKWHVKTLLKDLDMAKQLATNANSAIPMAGLGAELIRQHASNGFSEQDPATLITLYEKVDKPGLSKE